ncbi:MAG: DNA-binding protein, partial [Deltaproteobacteria bacterium]|nr:DNA-binding protein [Deltaproteobacteria bacterium]
MISRLIQQKAPIGSKVNFTLKSGHQVFGVLVEIGRDHICIKNKDGIATILTESIGAWEVIDISQEPPGKIDKAPSDRDVEIEIRRKIIEIETRFQTCIKNTRIGLKAPSLNFPSNEIQGRYYDNAGKVWDRIRNKYEYAQKINELSPKFGRIQLIANEIKSLVDRFPFSPTLKSHLGYFYYLLGNKPEALRLYKEA